MKAEPNFVIFTTNRSGSEWVINTLNGFPGVSAQGELFLPKPRSSEKEWYPDSANPRYIEAPRHGLRPFSVWSYLDGLYARPGRVGFKLMYKQLGAYPEILPYFLRRRMKVIHLVRRNHLDVMLSYAVKASIGHAHLLVGQSAPETLKVELDPRTLVRKMAWLQQQQDLARTTLRLTRLPSIEMAYEDLLRDQSLFHTLADFIEVSPHEELPQSALTRIRKGNHRDVIGNYEQVRRALDGSQFAGLLEG